jgi:hypothetical protein
MAYKSIEDYRKYSNLRRLQCLTHYSNGELKCADCNLNNLDVLVIDHINNDGNQHRKKIGGGGINTYRWLIKQGFPTGYQVLCHNCNWLKQLKLFTRK